MLRRYKDVVIGYKDESYPPIPTKFTLWLRRNILVQLFRFIVINIKVMRIIVGGHH